jgi:CopG family nickel-responsive transcriptional regulator
MPGGFMHRVTISLDETLAVEFDQLVKDTGYQSRSEAVRDLVRKAVESRRHEAEGTTDCVANLSYIYDHRTRGLAGRLTEIGNANHNLLVSTLQVPLDHESSFTSTILTGRTPEVRTLAEGIAAERGVRFAKLNLISVNPNDHHSDRHDHQHNDHDHLTPHYG